MPDVLGRDFLTQHVKEEINFLPNVVNSTIPNFYLWVKTSAARPATQITQTSVSLGNNICICG